MAIPAKSARGDGWRGGTLGGWRSDWQGIRGDWKEGGKMIAVLCGGVGAAKFLVGLLGVCDAKDIVAVVNTGDDTQLHGLHISPDLDTLVYTLSGEVNSETGWGRKGETWNALDTLRQLGGEAWFNLGDKDIGLHLFRTAELGAGKSLSQVTAEIAQGFGLELQILPMSDQQVATVICLAEDVPAEDVEAENAMANDKQAEDGQQYRKGEEISFQEYFVKLRHSVAVSGVRFEGADKAKPAPGVVEAIAEAEVLVLAPSNPVVSLGPPLAIAEIREAVAGRVSAGKPTVAISPLIGGKALKGPADRLMTELGAEATNAGIAAWYSQMIDTLVIDESDIADKAAVEATGVRCLVAPTIMHTPEIAQNLARAVLDWTTAD